MGEIVKREDLPIEQQSEEAYLSIRGYVIDAQKQVYSAVNAAMVTAYWNIGKSIYEVCGESDRAAYGGLKIYLRAFDSGIWKRL